MNKLKLLLLAMFMLCGYNNVQADVVEGYTVDFNNKIEDVATNHAFKVAPGWGHIVDTYTDWGDVQYVTYTWNSASGVDESGALGAGLGHDTYDLLVTPLVKGKVSIQVKRYLDNSSFTPLIEFYKVTRENGVLKRGEKLTTNDFTMATVADGFQEITTTVGDWTMIGLRCHAVFIDDFAADNADIVYEKKMAIKNWTSNNPETVVADDNGNFNVSYTVTVENNGEAPLTPGTEGYELIMKTNDNRVVATLPIDQTLAVGATSEPISFIANLNISDYPDRLRYNIYNGLNADDWKYGDWIEPISNSPMLVITRSGLSTSLAAGSTINFGPTRTDVVYPMVIKNKGAQDLNITEIVLPEGFTSDAELPITLSTDAFKLVNITMSANAVGEKSGNMVFKGNVNDQTYQLAGKVVAEDKWFANFEDNKIPNDLIADGSNWRVSVNVTEQANEVNKYFAENNKVEATRMVTPKMVVAEGEALTFDAARCSGETAELKVYYSADRNEWTLARTLSADAADAADKFSDELIYNLLYANYKFTKFTVNNIPAGEWYIAFEAGNAKVDNIEAYALAVVEHDLTISNLNMPAQGTVNTAFNVSATVKNTLAKDEAIDDMTVEFHLGNDVMELDPQAVEAGGSTTYNFAYTPHEMGEQEAYFVVRIGEYEAKSEVKTVNVSDEVASNEVVVGNFTKTDNRGPVDLYYMNSEIESVYTADMLGIAPGTKITSISYYGYNPGDLDINIQLWIENTTDETPASFLKELVNTDNMTKVYDGNYTVPAGGNATDRAELLSFTPAEPFVYTGGSIRIVAKKTSASYKSAQFEVDGNDNTHTMFRRNDNAQTMLNVDFQTTNLPVVRFGTERTPATVTGTVTAADGGAAVEGAKVSYIYDNVMYSGTTDAEGKYEVVVKQDGLQYQFKVVKSGYAPYVKENVNVIETPVVDAQLEVATGLILEDVVIPEEGTVNTEMKATATVMNPLTEDLTADSYTAALFFGEEKVAEAKPVTVASEKSAKLRFNFYPHKEGQFNATIKIINGDNTLSSEPTQVTIGEEVGDKMIQVGDEINVADSKSFGNFYYNISEMQTIYTPDVLNLPKGAKINSISIKGYSQSAKDMTAYQSLFLENTTDAAISTAAPRDTAEMTKVFAKNVEMHLVAGTANNVSVVLQFDFDEPFVYDGGNLRLAFHSASKSYNRIYFVTDNARKSMCRYNDTDINKGNWEECGMAVAYMQVTVGSLVEGTVTAFSDNSPIADADVTVKSGGVEYYGKTDADGKYTVNVLKSDLNYDVTVKAEGYADDVQSISFNEGNVTLTHQMKKEFTVTGVVTDASDNSPLADVAVKFMNGEEVAAEAATDADGKYTISLLEPVAENYTMTAEKGGYNPFSEEMTITEQLTEKNISLTHAAYKVSGTVTDEETGEAIINAQVSLNDILTNTDGEGYYEVMLAWPVEESYTLSAKAEGYADVVFDVAITDQSTVKDITMLKLRNVVSGKVTNTAGASIEGVTITLTKGDETVDATTDADGNYAITVIQADGDYSFKASKAGYGDFDATLTFAGDDLTQDVVLYTDEELSIGGINANGSRIIAGKDGIIVEGADGTVVNIYNYAGQLIRSERVSGGTVKIELPQGLYIVNGVKLTVK